MALLPIDRDTDYPLPSVRECPAKAYLARYAVDVIEVLHLWMLFCLAWNLERMVAWRPQQEKWNRSSTIP